MGVMYVIRQKTKVISQHSLVTFLMINDRMTELRKNRP